MPEPETTTTTTAADTTASVREEEDQGEMSREQSSSEPALEESEPAENFVNNGFRKWQEARDAWCGRRSRDVVDGTTSSSSESSSVVRAAIPIDVDEVIDVLFDPRWRGGISKNKKDEGPPRFPQNVPLPQMIDVLTDLWEAEGLDV